MAGVLIVEDDPDVRFILDEMLHALGFDSFESKDGAQTLDILETIEPDLLVVDLIMPNIDGIQLIETVRQSGSEIPIITISGTGDRELIEKAKEKGANLFLPKPVSKKELYEAVSSVLPPLDHLKNFEGA